MNSTKIQKYAKRLYKIASVYSGEEKQILENLAYKIWKNAADARAQPKCPKCGETKDIVLMNYHVAGNGFNADAECKKCHEKWKM